MLFRSVNPYLDAELRSNASQDTATRIEAEMKKLISDAYSVAMQVLRDNAATLNHLAEYLLLHENITGDEMRQLMEAEQSQSA